VISELVFAFSGGELGLVASVPARVDKFQMQSREAELHALQSWGELCIGLAAPRSNGTNYDGDTTLSFEVVKIMLECGMAHALLLAVHRVDLHHPMATSTIGSLILPFEIMSRPSVAEVVKSLASKAAKDASVKGAKEASRASRQATAAPTERARDGENSQRHDSFGDDHILDDGFVEDAGRGDSSRPCD